MGSPYSVSKVSRVSVVRSRKGLERALSSIASFGGDKSACRAVVALAMERLSTACFWDNFMFPLDSKSKDLLRNGMGEIYDWRQYDNLFTVLIDVAEAYYHAFLDSSRVVVVVEPRYDWAGHEKFGVALVIDLTKRAPSVVGV